MMVRRYLKWHSEHLDFFKNHFGICELSRCQAPCIILNGGEKKSVVKMICNFHVCLKKNPFFRTFKPLF